MKAQGLTLGQELACSVSWLRPSAAGNPLALTRALLGGLYRSYVKQLTPNERSNRI